MSLLELFIKEEYRSFREDVVRQFYIPTLKKAKIYKRAVGFFSSSALIEISKGLSKLIHNEGKIELIVSPKLDEEDIIAIKEGFELRENVINNAVLRNIKDHDDELEQERLNLLTHLIADGYLDIKVAFIKNNNGLGMFHEKLGLIIDKYDNKIAFSGSMNESLNAFSSNYESIDVFKSWGEECNRVESKLKVFNDIWEDNVNGLEVINFPEVALNKLMKYKKEKVDFNLDNKEFLNDSKSSTEVLETIKLRDYQTEAIDNWEKEQFRGIFDMATGTGKTFTGLGAAMRLYERKNKNLAIIIVCPYQHLVEQWVEDIRKFGFKPIIGYSASKQKRWKQRLSDAVISFSSNIKKTFCFITTNATYSTDFVQNLIKNQLEGNLLLIVDEAHNFGSTNLRSLLHEKIPYRLALSATIERHGDEEGTKGLYSYFGERCITYTLKDAIDNNMLTPYHYYPIVVSLNNEELEEYFHYTNEIKKYFRKDDKGNLKVNESGKMLLLKRANVIAGAQNKINILKEIVSEGYSSSNNMLVYCGATTVQDPIYNENHATEEEKRQIDIVSKMLGSELGMKVAKFTSEENINERKIIKQKFAEGDQLQTLVAIRCLDEGVNIPSVKTAFILASSTNPKEYIQRRGRVLRLYDGKEYAEIYDFITLPVPLSDANNLSDDEIAKTRSLLQKEINRMKDFVSISENPSYSYNIIEKIENAFDINIIRGESYDF